MAFFKSLIEKFTGTKDDAQKLYRERVKEAVGDGRLTTDKIKELDQLKKELDVEGPAADATMYRAAAYQAAVDAVKAGGVLSDAEAAELERIQNYLGLRDAQVQHSKLELARLRQLTEIRQGKLPVISQNNVILRSIKLDAGEVPHWTETITMLEETGTSAGTSGFGLRLVRGTSFQPGAAKGYVVPVKAGSKIAEGRFLLTNQRFLIKTDAKSYSFKLEQPDEIHVFRDGLRLKFNQRKVLLQFSGNTDNSDFMGLIISHLIGGK